MKHYIIPILVYLLAGIVLDFFHVPSEFSYAVRAVVVLGLIVFFWDKYKIKFKFSWFAFIAGIAVFLLWVSLEGSNKIVYNPEGNYQMLWIIVKIFGMVLVAPVIEELFVRDFLARFTISPDKWESVKIGTFAWLSFIVTVLIFTLAHWPRWIQGLVAALLYSAVLYKTKRIDACIQAHAVTNLLLAAFTIYTQNWAFW